MSNTYCGEEVHVCTRLRFQAREPCGSSYTDDQSADYIISNILIVASNFLLSLALIKFHRWHIEAHTRAPVGAVVREYNMCAALWHHWAFKHTVSHNTWVYHVCAVCSFKQHQSVAEHHRPAERPTPFVYISTLHPCIPVVDLTQTD